MAHETPGWRPWGMTTKLSDLLVAVRDGRPARDGAVPVVTPDGFLDWTYL